LRALICLWPQLLEGAHFWNVQILKT